MRNMQKNTTVVGQSHRLLLKEPPAAFVFGELIKLQMHVKCWKSKEGYMSTRTTYSRRHAGMVNTNIQPMITEQQGLAITRLCCCRSTANTGMIKETLLLTAKLLGNFILRKIKIAQLIDGMINSYQSHMHVDIFENLTHMLLVLH